MSRATVVYLVMLAAFVGGLWAVLAIGATLTAPEDLGGRWVAAGPPAGAWPGLTVDQSGRYFELAFDHGPTVNVTAHAPDADGRVELDRGPWHVTVDPPRGGTRTFRVDGPTPGTFVGRRDRPTTGPAK